MIYKDFENFLAEKFGRDNPGVLDDDWPDAYNDWLVDLDVDTLIKWGNEYAQCAVERATRKVSV